MAGLGDLKGPFQPSQFRGSVVVVSLLGKIIFHSAQGSAVAVRVASTKEVQIEPLKIKCIGHFWLLCPGLGTRGKG